jgi:glycosyltransferase involved in cell wall biosynthesis
MVNVEPVADDEYHAGLSAVPTFSVVIPAYNAERTLRATVVSVFGQTRSDFEVIVVDDGSTDATAGVVEALENDPRIRLVRRPNGGVAIARNAGIAVAQGQYVCFLDADDVWLPTYLEAMGNALDARREAGLAFTDAWVWDEGVRRFGRRTIMDTGNPPTTVPDDARDLFRRLLAANFMFTSTTVRRDALADVGGFDARVSPSEDWELWLRFAARGYRAVRAAPVLAVYRKHAGSLSSDPGVMRESERRSLETVATYDLDHELRELVGVRLAVLAEGALSPARVEARGRERLTRHLPSFARLRSYRRRPPRGVSPDVVRLLRDPHGST